MMMTKRMMNLSFEKNTFLLLLLITFSIVHAQSENLRGFRFNLPPETIELQLNELEFNRLVSFYLTSLTNDTTILWIKTNLQMSALSNYFSSTQGQPNNILSPLYQNYVSSQSMRTIKSILGSVSFGATAFLAYKHLKKYGFLKKK